MALVPIQVGPPVQKKDTLDKLVQGFALAQSIVGTGLAVPKFFQERGLAKAEKAKTEAETDVLKAESAPPSPEDVAGLASLGVPKDALRTNKDVRDWQKRVYESPKDIADRENRKIMMDFAANAEGRAQREEGRKTDELKKPKKLGEATIKNLDEGRAIPALLKSVETILDQKSDMFGPLVGRAGQANPYASQQQIADAQLRSASQAFGRYMEGGVLRKEDEEKYRKMFPQLSDTIDVAKGKLASVAEMLEMRQKSLVSAYKDQNFDVSGFDESGSGDVDGDGQVSKAEKWILDNPNDARVPMMIKAIKDAKGNK